MAKTKATKEPGIQLIEGSRGPYYRVQIRVKGCPHLSKNFETFLKAKDWKTKTVNAVKSGLPFETTEMRRLTVGDLIDRFIQSDLKNLRNHKTILGHLQWWKKEIGYCILSQFREDIIAKCRDKLKNEPDKFGKSRSSSTVNRYLCSMGSVINIAVQEWRLLPFSPLKNIRKLAEPRGGERFLSKEEKNRLLEACQNSSCKLLSPIVLLALSSGMRRGEILDLKWKDIDLENGRITLHHTKNGEPIRFNPGAKVMATLKDYITATQIERKDDSVFITRAGKPVYRTHFQHILDQASEKARLGFKATMTMIQWSEVAKSLIDHQSEEKVLEEFQLQSLPNFLEAAIAGKYRK